MFAKKSFSFIFFFLFTVLSIYSQQKDDKKMNVFIDNLMKRMTLEEKIGQLNLVSIGFDVTGPILNKNVDEKIRKGLVGAVFNTYTPQAVRKLQEMAVNETRLKIPLLFGYDVVHGHKTIFPVPLGLSATWDIDLIEQTARAAADEASADGLNWTFSPMTDISRDPRWGRVSEGSGEDPYLGARIAEAMVRGYEQGDISRNNTVMSCIKHFALYGASEAGRDYNTVDMSRIRMYNEYFPPYKAGVDAGASTVMTSFNEIDGIPATANKWLLTDLLRKEWGFKGFVVTDYTAVMELTQHGVGNPEKVTELALNAGTDMDMVSEYFINYAGEAVKSGQLTQTVIDEACRRILEAKYKCGLFENPYKYVNEERAETQIMSEEKLTLAQKAAVKSIVLLKNQNDILPLDASKKIAFIGPLVKGQRDLIGNWSGAGKWNQAETIWAALEDKFGPDKFNYAYGCNMIDNLELRKKLNPHNGNLQISEKTPRELIDEAVKTAQASDIVVAVLGETCGMSGEAASRSNIGLLQNQVDLLKALKATGKPVVLILMNGRPLILDNENETMDAILETWFAGTKAGSAIADVLFGDENPSGKITMTFPKNIGQIPIYYNHKNTGRPFDEKQKYTTKYLDVSNEPLYPFGYGLSYTTFEYGDITLSKKTITANEKLIARIIVTNTGKRTGEETVQLYIRDKVGSITRPVKELKGFEKITLKPGEPRTVTFEINNNDLKFYNENLQYTAEPGDFEIFIGGNSRDVKSAEFTLK